MPQSLSAVYVHGIFSTKERRALLQVPSVRADMHSYLGGICRQLKCPPIKVGGIEDHVHLLARLSRTISQADWVKETKRSSTQWINQAGLIRGSFAWQAGYALFSVSPSELDSVARYIADQEKHHHQFRFQDELRALLKQHGIEWDERYVWD